MAEEVGRIDLGLNVNQQYFNKQLNGIANSSKKSVMSSFKPIGKVIGTVLGAAAVVGFTKSCLDLGSSLQEVQNVVDVTFPHMSDKINDFAQNAASQFGLSETMAKKFSGTFGAMAKSFGFTESEAYKMSTALTGLTGDVASFYNITQDEAYTKLKSVFSGETETLKDLGIVMTQSALDAYALANGFGKTTSAMSEQEKVALRLAFVQNQLSAASGDFVRTSDSWANQTRLLSLQFDSLRASIGQGLIQVFTPVIKVINLALGKVLALAKSFASLTGKLFGKQDTAAVENALGSVEESAQNTAKEYKNVGTEAKKAQKALLGFDKINKLPDLNSSSGANAGAGANGGGSSTKDISKAGKTTATMMTGLQKQFNQLKALFAGGFAIGAGKLKQSAANCKKHILNIGDSLKDIFTDKRVGEAVKLFFTRFVANVGKRIGAMVSVGMTIAENLLGGIDLWLQQSKEQIIGWICELLDISGEIDTLTADFSVACANIFSAFRSDTAKQLTADIIGCFTSAFANVLILAGKLGRDIISCITGPIVDNSEKIKTALENTLKPLQTMSSSFKETWNSAFASIQKMYDEHFKPFFVSIRAGLSKVVEAFLEAYNKHIVPMLTRLSEKFKAMTDAIRPAIDKLCIVIGKIADVLKAIWDNALVPFWKFVIKKMIPKISEGIETIQSLFLGVGKAIGNVISGIMDVIGGLIDFVTGVFTGNWSKAWNGIKGVVSGVCGAIKGIFTGVFDILKIVLNSFLSFFSGIWERIKAIFSTVASWFSSVFSSACEGIKLAFSTVGDFFSGVWTGIKDCFSSVKSWFSSIFSGAWNGIKKAFSSVGGFFGEVWTKIKKCFGAVGSWFSSIFSGAWSGIKGCFDAVGGFFGGVWDGIKGCFTKVKTWFGDKFDAAAEAIKTPFKAIGSWFGSVFNGIKTVIKTPLNWIIKAINTIISGLNKLSFSLPDWAGGYSFGLDIPKIPELATGGYVKPNTPQLAMIGDNRHQGEVVAPEDKLLEMARKAAALSTGDDTQVVRLLNEIIRLLKALDLDVTLDGDKIKKNVVRRINNSTTSTGKLELIIP